MLNNMKTLSYLSDICVCSICMGKRVVQDIADATGPMLIMVTTGKGLGCGKKRLTFYFMTILCCLMS